MSNYAIMRFQKYKLGSVANIERHQKHRDRLHNRAHPEREKENISYSQYNETMTGTQGDRFIVLVKKRRC